MDGDRVGKGRSGRDRWWFPKVWCSGGVWGLRCRDEMRRAEVLVDEGHPSRSPDSPRSWGVRSDETWSVGESPRKGLTRTHSGGVVVRPESGWDGSDKTTDMEFGNGTCEPDPSRAPGGLVANETEPSPYPVHYTPPDPRGRGYDSGHTERGVRTGTPFVGGPGR